MKSRSFSRWKTCPGFLGDGASVLWSVIVESWNGLGQKGPLMIISFHPLFCSFPQFPLRCSGSSASIFLGKRFHRLIPLSAGSSKHYSRVSLAQQSLGALSHPARLGWGTAIIPFFWDLLRAPGHWGILPVLLWSSCSQLTKSTWTAVLRGEWVSASMKFGICAGGSTAAAWPSLSGSPRH